MSSNISTPFQKDLFTKPVFETREPVQKLDLDRFRSRIKRGMAAALSEISLPRADVVKVISAMPGVGNMSKAMLDAYTSEAKSHDISLVRFKALIRATGAIQLWDQAVSDEGLIILQGDEARLAEIARLQQEQKLIGNQLRVLRSVPVVIKPRTA
ncbi:MAG: hypothetical protein QM488_18390 [Rhizobiaceae bacterium]